jgi:AcrR family transcriptional regulator
MPTSVQRPRRKPRGRYHHGDLRAALVAEALRTMQTSGIEQLTLRAVGDRLGVSRTALYRHFADKQALLAAVAAEGFRMLREQLVAARETHPAGAAGFEAMGRAYVRFAVTHRESYRVMFGRFIEACSTDQDLAREAQATFQTLVDALAGLQEAALIRQDDPVQQAAFIWAVVHGVAMLAIDGQLAQRDPDATVLTDYAVARLRDALQRPAV